jgi:hypothetical protein
MFCAHCGVQIMPGQIFCSRCGQRIIAAPASGPVPQPVTPLPSSTNQISPSSPGAGYAEPSRVARNISALGALWILYSVLRLIPGIALFALGHLHFPFLMAPFPFSGHLFMAPFLGAIGLLISCTAVAGIIAGWGLMAHQPWARVLAIVLGFLSVIHFPLGTALAVYTFWVLLAGGAEAEYQNLARAN